MKGFTLVEILVSAVILCLIIAGLFGVLNIGNATYNTERYLLDLQQKARYVMDRMIRELREGLRSSVNISAGNTRITFNTPDEPGMQYYRDISDIDGDGRVDQIFREYPAGTRNKLVQEDIESLNFSLSGNLLQIQITAKKTQRPDLTFFLKEQVRLRNE